jgi:hypothetical protein
MAIRKRPRAPETPACDCADRIADLEATVAALSRALGGWSRHPGARTVTANIAAWSPLISDADLTRIGHAARRE